MYKRELNYELEVEPDADVIAILFSRTLRSLPLDSKTRQTTLRSPPIRVPAQRMMMTRIHKDSRSLWGGY